MKKSFAARKIISLLLVFATLLCISAFSASAVSAEAQAFAEAVDAINPAAELSVRQTQVDAADEKLRAYTSVEGNKKTDSDIADKYELLVAIKSDMYVEYVAAAEQAYDYNDDYVETRKNLDAANKLSADLNNSTAVIIAKSTVSRIEGELVEPEGAAALFVERVTNAKTAVSYDEKKELAKLAEGQLGDLTLEDYPGLAEAKADLTVMLAEIDTTDKKVNKFVRAVSRIMQGEDIMTAVPEAYEYYETLDKKIAAVKSAKSDLDFFVRSYNSEASDANSFANETQNALFGMIMGGKKNGGFADSIKGIFGK